MDVNKEIGIGEAFNLIMGSMTRATVKLAGVAEKASEPLDHGINILNNYGTAGEQISESHGRTSMYTSMGNEAQKIERLKTRFPNMDWDKILKDAIS